MPSWRRPRRRLLGWLSNSRKNSGSGGGANQQSAVGSRQPASVAVGCTDCAGVPLECLVFPGRGRVLGKWGLLGSL